MIIQFIKKNFSILSFIFTASISCGVIFLGVLSSFAYMLYESGMPASKISLVLFFATIPYSFRFVMAPFLKNILNKFNNSNHNIIKIISYSMQLIMIILLATLGIFEHTFELLRVILHVFILIVAISVHDIINDHIRLTCFHGRDIGLASSIETVGFRLGMLISGAGIIHTAEIFSWQLAFIIASSTILFCTISTIFLPKIKIRSEEKKIIPVKSVSEYIKFCSEIFKKHGFWLILILFFSYKFSDSCINNLRPMFLQSLGFGKVDFANISQILGTFFIIFGGIIAGAAAYKFGTSLCIKTSFLLQMICSICFIILSEYKFNIVNISAILSLSTLLFGFSSAILRIYISEQSKSDVNTFFIFTSLGSIARICTGYIGGLLTDYVSWKTLYFICLLSNVPGFFAYIKMRNCEKN